MFHFPGTHLFSRSTSPNIEKLVDRYTKTKTGIVLSDRKIGKLLRFAYASKKESLIEIIHKSKQLNECSPQKNPRFFQISCILKNVINSKIIEDICKDNRRELDSPRMARLVSAPVSGRAVAPSKATHTEAPPPPPPPPPPPQSRSQSPKIGPDTSEQISEKQSGATQSSSPVRSKKPHSSDGHSPQDIANEAVALLKLGKLRKTGITLT